jgi:hypothetical protein
LVAVVVALVLQIAHLRVAALEGAVLFDTKITFLLLQGILIQ